MNAENVKVGGFYLLKAGKRLVGVQVASIDENVITSKDRVGSPYETTKPEALLWELDGGFDGTRIDSPDAAPDKKADAKKKKAEVAALNKAARKEASDSMKKNAAERKAKKAAAKAAKPAKKPKAEKAAGKKKASGEKKASNKKAGDKSLRELGIQVLKSHKGKEGYIEMNCPDIIAELSDKGLWKSPNGATPERTLYTAFLRELAKDKASQVEWVGKGMWKFRAID